MTFFCTFFVDCRCAAEPEKNSVVFYRERRERRLEEDGEVVSVPSMLNNASGLE